jgi:hypothetical protein
MLAQLSLAKMCFSQERNTGLVQQAIDRAPRWSIKKLTATYLTLGLSEIGKAVGIDNEEDVRRLVLDMVSHTLLYNAMLCVLIHQPAFPRSHAQR